MAQKTLKINIFPVFSLLIREFWSKNISILLQILHTPWKSKTPRKRGFWFPGEWSNTNCLVLRRDWKPAALCEFEAVG